MACFMGSQLTTQQDKSKSPSGGVLYIVATPIGNLGDMTFRAVETLKSVALIACEDTRVTATLLHHFDIRTPTLSYNDHNGARQRPRIIDALAQGESVALVSDAGTPLISDPGYKLVTEVRALGFDVCPIPGASSVMAALCACGLPTDQFHFSGFLPTKTGARTQMIASLAAIPGSLVLFESARRLHQTLIELHQGLGDSDAVIARELTKRFEEFRRAPLQALIASYADTEVKGEVVIVIAPGDKPAWADADIDQLLVNAMHTQSTKEAAASVAKETGLSRSELYQRALQLK